MQVPSKLWKEVSNPKTDRSMIEGSRSKSKNKKYAPTRKQNLTQLHNKIMNNSHTKLEISNPANLQKENSYLLQKQLDNNESKEQIFPIKSQQQSFVNDKNIKIKVVRPSVQEMQSSNVIMKQLSKIKKLQADQDSKPTKTLSSLDQQHEFIQKQLQKIKTDFKKYKQIVETELIKQQMYMENIVNKILKEFSRVLQVCDKCSQRINLDNLRLDYMREMQSEILGQSHPEISSINKAQSTKQEYKLDLKRLKLNTSFNTNKPQSSRTSKKQNQMELEIKTLCSPKSFMQVNTSRSDFNMNKNIINKSMSTNALKPRSKVQFAKLFEAVSCLKKDIKDLKDLSFEIPYQETNSRNITQNRPKQKQQMLINIPMLSRQKYSKQKSKFAINQIKR